MSDLTCAICNEPLAVTLGFLHHTTMRPADVEDHRAELADRYDLKQFRQTTNAACEKARVQYNNFGSDPINWADFGCRGAYFQADDEGNESYMVAIEEASPDCRHIKEFVSRELEAAGFVGVEVQTEW